VQFNSKHRVAQRTLVIVSYIPSWRAVLVAAVHCCVRAVGSSSHHSTLPHAAVAAAAAAAVVARQRDVSVTVLTQASLLD
jgi:hypothetical protein